jgi:hypothetical protein
MLAVLASMSGWFLAAPGARAEDRLHLRWTIGEETLRYELEEDRARRSGPETGLAPVLDPIRTVVAGDLELARHWVKVDVRDLSDLVWFVALSLPEHDFANAGGKAPFSERWKLPSPQGELAARGDEEVSRQGHLLAVKTRLEVAQENLATNVNPPARPWLGKTTLSVERTYNEIRKQIVDARFDLSTVRLEGDAQVPFELHGRIALATSKESLAEVQATIKRAVAFTEAGLQRRLSDLKGRQNEPCDVGHAPLGLVALPTFALLRSGVPAAKLQAAFDFMAGCDFKEVYSVSLYLLALEARSVRRIDVPPVAGGHTVARFAMETTPSADEKEMARAAKWLVEARLKGKGSWSYRGVPEHHGTQAKTAKPAGPNRPLDKNGAPTESCDRSNSQCAVLALHAAAARGIAIDPAVWQEVLDESVASQEPDGPARAIRGCVEWNGAAPPGTVPDLGVDPLKPYATRSKSERERDDGEGTRARGWGYWMSSTPTKPGEVYSITAAGLSSVVIAREALRRSGKLDASSDERSRRAIADGVAWMLPWSLTTCDPGSWTTYYTFYSYEKALEVAGIDKLAGRDWWADGALKLLQLEDAPKKGSWHGGELNDTSFALLFLDRATLPATVVVQDAGRTASGNRDPLAWDQAYVDGTGHVRMRQVLYVLESTATEASLAVAEKGFALLDEDVRPRLVPDLVRLLQSSSQQARIFAEGALKATCGTADERAARVFARRWEELALVARSLTEAALPTLRALLRDAQAPRALRRGACLVLDRLLVTDALDDLLSVARERDESLRRLAATTISRLAPGAPSFDPSGAEDERGAQLDALSAWLAKNRADLAVESEARRRVRALAFDAAAADVLKKLGAKAIHALASEGLRDPATQALAHAILRELTGEALPPEPGPWLDWWEKHR